MKNLLWACAALGFVLLLVIVAKTPITPLAADASNPQLRFGDPSAVLQAYYTALNGRDIPAAVELVPDDVILQFQLLPTSQRVEYTDVEQVQHWLENDHTVLSRSIGELFVKGDRVEYTRVEYTLVEYTLVEWLDPRQAGPNAHQPRVTHWTARVRNGKILALVQSPLVD